MSQFEFFRTKRLCPSGTYGAYGTYGTYGAYGTYGTYGNYGFYGVYGVYGTCGAYGTYGAAFPGINKALIKGSYFYAAIHCSANCSSRANLNTHIKSKHQNQGYNCNVCTKTIGL